MLFRGGNRQASFVDIIGFKDLPEFLTGIEPARTPVQAVTERPNEQMKQLMKKSLPEGKEAAVKL